jgi:hypothetical protein
MRHLVRSLNKSKIKIRRKAGGRVMGRRSRVHLAFRTAATPTLLANRRSSQLLASGLPPESPSYLGAWPCPTPILFICGGGGVIQPYRRAAKMHQHGRIAVHLYRKIRKLSRTRGCSVSVTAACILVGSSIMSGVLIAEGWELFLFSSAVAALRTNCSRFKSAFVSIFQWR